MVAVVVLTISCTILSTVIKLLVVSTATRVTQNLMFVEIFVTDSNYEL